MSRGDIEEARAHLSKLRELVPEASEVVALAKGIAAREEQAEADRQRKAEAERDKRERLRPGREFRDCTECPEMIVVPAGSFVMGSPASEQGRGGDEGPQREVTLSRPFAVGKFEVTFAQWDACVFRWRLQRVLSCRR